MLPILEMDGKIITQSNAIARYLAEEHGLTGKDKWEALQCDILVDTLGDLKQGKYNFFFRLLSPLFSRKSIRFT